MCALHKRASTSVLHVKHRGRRLRWNKLNYTLTFRSCSLPCFKTHRAQCAASQDHAAQPATSTATTQDVKAKPAAGHPQSPSREELNELFKKYPTLKEQLRDIYRTTQQTEEREEDKNSFRGGFGGRARGRGRGRGQGTNPAISTSQHRWDPEKGSDRGLRQLERALAQDDAKSEALQAFADTVLRTKKV